MNKSIDNRRSERKPQSVALQLSANLGDGTTAEVQAETIVVNRHGAKIHADLNLLLGCPVKITVEGSDEPVDAVVAWVSKDKPGEFGIEVVSAPAPWEQKKS